MPGAKKLSVDTAGSDIPGRKVRREITHKGRWPTDKEVGAARYL
jgi:hypothetical protein